LRTASRRTRSCCARARQPGPALQAAGEVPDAGAAPQRKLEHPPAAADRPRPRPPSAISRTRRRRDDGQVRPARAQEKQTLGEEQTARATPPASMTSTCARSRSTRATCRPSAASPRRPGSGCSRASPGSRRAGLTGLQNPANADAAARGATAGDLSPLASNAAAIRQALVGSFVAQQAGQTAAARTTRTRRRTSSHRAEARGAGDEPGPRPPGRRQHQGDGARARRRRPAVPQHAQDRRGQEHPGGQIAGIDAADKLADNALAAQRSHRDDAPQQGRIQTTRPRRCAAADRDKCRARAATRPASARARPVRRAHDRARSRGSASGPSSPTPTAPATAPARPHAAPRREDAERPARGRSG
jgi:hypothetical protein